VRHVPTVAELVHLGLARPAAIVKGQAQAFVISDAGHALMGEAMRANALEAIARGDGSWTPPTPTMTVPLSALIDRETHRAEYEGLT